LIYPEYNILKFAGNRQGFIHSEATKELQRNARLGTVLSERAKLMMPNNNPKSTPITVYSQDPYCYGSVYSHGWFQNNESKTKNVITLYEVAVFTFFLSIQQRNKRNL
jgi:hypothetical protein